MPRALLINPWIYDFAAFDYWAKPLGLLYLAESLRRKGLDVTFIDCLGTSEEKRYGAGPFLKEEIPKPRALQGIARRYSRYGISEEAFIRSLTASPRPDIVLVTSVMTYWYPGVFRALELVREHFKDVPIILGGIYATLCHKHAKKYSGADQVYKGKAGKDFFQLLSHYMPIDVTNKEDPVMDCRPAFDLLDNPRYGVLTTSEGCPFKCSYCAAGLLNIFFRQKPHENCFNEILWMHDVLRLKDIAFYDDALLIRAESHFTPLMEKICQSSLDIRFHTPNGLHVRDISSDIAMLLKEGGFKTIRLGMEVIKSDRELIIDDKASYEELLRAIALLKEAGFDCSEIGIYLLSGLPGQTREEVEECMRKVREAGARPYLSEFSPIPGTDLWQEAKKASPYPIEGEPLFQNPSLSPCTPEGFTIERLSWRKRILEKYI